MAGDNTNSDPSNTPTPAAAAVDSSSKAVHPKKRRRKSADITKAQSANLASQPSSSEGHQSPAQNPPVPHPIYQHYPYLMNPPYPPHNGAPYPQGHPPPPPHPGYSGSPSHVHPPPMPGHFGYGIPPAYPPYSYQYAPPMMMYGQPQPAPGEQPPPQSVSAGPADDSAGNKRKRKSASQRAKGVDLGSDDEAEGGRGQGSTQSASVDLKKRTKTQRACDSCRSRKIRCDILPDTEPPLCQHCKQYGFDCTYFLPITETRFRKKRLEEWESQPVSKGKTEVKGAPSSDVSQRDVGVFGPTSTTHLIHSHSTISSRVYEGYDLRYNHTYEVSQGGDGLIQVRKSADNEQPVPPPKAADVWVDQHKVQQLLNAYFTDVAPLLPVVTQAEFLAHSTPPPILLYSMCLVAAARRDESQLIFDSIRYAVSSLIRSEDVLSTPSTVNLQALLILCMLADCHSPVADKAVSSLWVRLGAAIRMAQDLGLHRAEQVRQDVALRRRLWSICIVSDRWTSLIIGHPQMIDIQDCDALLPSTGDPSLIYLDQITLLSIHLGRVMKAIYSPAGLNITSDEFLGELLAQLEGWKENLPPSLQFTGPDSSQAAGMLHLLYTCVMMMFWRVFMRISYSCPDHIKFSLTIDEWTKLVNLSAESIDWLDAHERTYDTWTLVAYAGVSLALIQYHTWARRRDEEASAKLRKLRDTIQRWEKSMVPEHMSAGRKTAEIVILLYEATQGPRLPNETPLLNPTGGVTSKQPVEGLDYKKDPTRPGGGVFVARGQARDRQYKDLPEGTVINGSSDEENESPSGAAPSSLVNFTPLHGTRHGSTSNLNPALNTRNSNGNQVLNILDMPASSNTIAESSMSDQQLLEGIPGSISDWGQWDNFFSRIHPEQQRHQQPQPQQ